MLAQGSDVFEWLADAAATVDPPASVEDVLVEAVAAIHHLCDQYDLEYDAVVKTAKEIYSSQQQRELSHLEGLNE